MRYCLLSIFLFIPIFIFAQFSREEINRWAVHSSNTSIIRDIWGIPHIYGKTDADAVFGLMYAQAEDDFPRVELNYLEKLGRLSEIQGVSSLYEDLLIRMLINEEDARKEFITSPIWLKKLLQAYADGLNCYLFNHPESKPLLLERFEPWYPLLWTDGSIGAISTAGISANDLKSLYETSGQTSRGSGFVEPDQKGSNGFAIAPKKTRNGHALLYINPHVTFYFRPEVHMISEEGLNAYGAVTWGQFFVYQGFNEFCGWMHTSSRADISDAYIENMINKNGRWYYKYENETRELIEKEIEINYLEEGRVQSRKFNCLYTHHGPVLAKKNGQYLSLRHNNRDINGLIQSWLRTKSSSFADFKKTMDLLANPSNNTVYADREGNIAYWHGNFIPRRNPDYDWSRPVDGSVERTEWMGLHPVEESVHVYNPGNGWIQNCNSTPFTVSGDKSPKKDQFPSYMAPDGENYRGINAARVLGAKDNFTVESLIDAGYDKKLEAFEDLLPALIHAYDLDKVSNNGKFRHLEVPVETLRSWDFQVDEKSVATSLAIHWGEKLLPNITRVPGSDQVEKTLSFASSTNYSELLEAFDATIKDLSKSYGSWNIAWGEINRIQRISNGLEPKFDDKEFSIPVGFASATWGMLPSYNSRSYAGTKKRYGVSGNSFIASVEFGPRIRAKSLLAGGQSGHKDSKHFSDQMDMYARGVFKDVLFYREDVLKYAESTYHPGSR